MQGVNRLRWTLPATGDHSSLADVGWERGISRLNHIVGLGRLPFPFGEIRKGHGCAAARN
jgi:hypothetical protein